MGSLDLTSVNILTTPVWESVLFVPSAMFYGMIHQITHRSFHYKKLSVKSGSKAPVKVRPVWSVLETYACQGPLLFYLTIPKLKTDFRPREPTSP